MAKNVFCAIAAAWLAVFLFVSTAAGDGFPAAKIVRIYFQDDTIARFDLLPLHLGIEEVGAGWIQAYAKDWQITKANEMGYDVDILWEDARDRAAERRAEMERDDRWTGYAAAVTLMNSIALAHPDICRMHNIGTTVSGRTLWVMEITDTPDIDEVNEPEVRLAGNIHGDEYVSF